MIGMRGIFVMLTLLGAAAAAADEAQVERGQRVFSYHCAPCHGRGPGIDGSPMLPGTAALQARYQGRLPAALEDRNDLSAPMLKGFVRGGIGPMPMFRPTEVSDQDIEAIAAYLGSHRDQSD